LLIAVSIAANFVLRQALDTNEFRRTAHRLIADDAIQNDIAANLTEQLYTRVDVQAELQRVLPADQQGLAGPVAGAMRPVANRLAKEIVQRPLFQDGIVAALGVAQRQVARLLEQRSRLLEAQGGMVALNLRPLLVELANRIPIARDLGNRVPQDAGVIPLFQAQRLEPAQRTTHQLAMIGRWIWVPALVALILAVWLSRDRLRQLRGVALGLVVVGVLLLVLRRFAGRYFVDRVASPSIDDTAAHHAWRIITQLFAHASWAAIALGVIVLAALWLAGSTQKAVSVRRSLASFLSKPELAFGAAAVLFLLLLLWGPLSVIQRPLPILALAVLMALGVEWLRRLTAREARMAQAAPFGAARVRIEEGGAGAARTSSQADDLERLTKLRAQGVLTEEEFAAAKKRLLRAG
jgi:hypothetical protein